MYSGGTSLGSSCALLQRVLPLVTDAVAPLLGRAYSSLPETVAAPCVPDGQHLQVGRGANPLLLLSLPERPWGAVASLPASVVESITGSRGHAHIGIMREAFKAFDVPVKSVSQFIRRLDPGTLAVSSELSDAENRIIVDEYHLGPGGAYQLTSMASDLLQILRHHQEKVCWLPLTEGPLKHNSVRAAARGVSQSTNEVLMVAPTAFGFNEQAAQDNSFMHKDEQAHKGSHLTYQVLKEFASLYHQLSEVAGVKVNLFQHDLSHGTPDACFPNNWFSTHPVGEAHGGVAQSTLVLYPMKCPNRAMERRPDIINVLRHKGYARVVDMSPEERKHGGLHFEGTGVLVLDRVNGVAYVDISERADRGLAERWVDELGYRELVAFTSKDQRGHPVYHTNVMMAVGTDVAVVCADSVPDEKERQHLLSRLRRHHEVVEISQDQMDAMCGNCLELVDGRGLPVMAMSSQAYGALTPDQKRLLLRHVSQLVHAPIDTLERVGGGSVRCCLGEVF